VNAKPIKPTPTTAHPGDFKNVYASKARVTSLDRCNFAPA